MKYRYQGNSGLKVSELSVGSYLTFGEKVGEKETTKIVCNAHELGINFFDTANVYQNGEAERLLSLALKHVDRHSVVVGTKAYYPTGPLQTQK